MTKNILHFTFYKKQPLNRGVASLPTIIALTVIILAIGIGITSLALTESLISAGQKQSSQALFYAEAGARDALIKIARNKKYECPAADCYSIPFTAGGCTTNEGCARVSVSAGAGSQVSPKIITSAGVVRSNTKKLQITVVFDTNIDGEIATSTWQEI